MEDWQKLAEESKAKKEFKKKWPLLGTVVSRMGEKGVIVLIDLGDGDEYGIRYDNKREYDTEQLDGLPWDECPDYELKYINTDGTLKN